MGWWVAPNMLRGAEAHKAFKNEDIDPHIGLRFVGPVGRKLSKKTIFLILIVFGSGKKGVRDWASISEKSTCQKA